MRGFLLDLDGTLYTDEGPTPGGPAAVEALQRRGVPFRCLTNTTRRSAAELVDRLAGYGYPIGVEAILTPARAAVRLCEALGIERALALSPARSLADMGGLTLVRPGEPADAVIVGDLGAQWSYDLLQAGFRCLNQGAKLIALSRDRYFQQGGELALDAGPFVAALEYASGATATVVGKPSPDFYRLAVAGMGLASSPAVAMVGDDVWSDVQGAQAAGLSGWLVRTGKYREELLERSGVRPDRVLGSVAELGGEP